MGGELIMDIVDEDYVLLTQCCRVRDFTKKQYMVLLDLCLRANGLHNCAVDVACLSKASDGIHYREVNYFTVLDDVKEEYYDVYSGLQAHIANNVIRKHVDSLNSYVALSNKKIDGKYDKPVHRPKKHDNRLQNLIIPRQSITSSKKKLAMGYIDLPLSRNYKKELDSLDCRPRIKIPQNIRDKDLVQVEIIPVNNGEYFKAHFTYRERKKPLNLDKDKVMGIDLGVNNFATIVTTEGTPRIVAGGYLKNLIYFRCKKVAHYQSLLNKQGLTSSKRLIKLNDGYYGRSGNFLNHAVKYIIDTCIEQDVGTIVLGYNKDFQNKTNMGVKQNQIFSHIAFKQFKTKLENKCRIHELDLIIQEESYTSKSSFLDDDILPTYQPGQKKNHKYNFKGRRAKRGLYQTQDGILINADVNAAANIIKKSNQNFDYEELSKRVQTTPIKIKNITQV